MENMTMLKDVKLRDITLEDISMIQEQWELNRMFHEQTSEHFTELYKSIGFTARMRYFEKYAPEDLKITVATTEDKVIGYCISTAVEGEGEICTLHVDMDFRGARIGKRLCEDHILWMKQKVCTFISVTVSQENQPTIGFYNGLGFYTNTVQMVLK